MRFRWTSLSPGRLYRYRNKQCKRILSDKKIQDHQSRETNSRIPPSSAMSSRRLSTLWAREIRGSQNLCLSRSASRSPITLVSASCAYTEQPLKSIATRSYSQSKVSDLAKDFSRRPGNAAETYVAYGMTQKLFEACSSQADYKIPQALQKGAEVPKTEAGEDLGVGEGWWYKGETTPSGLWLGL